MSGKDKAPELSDEQFHAIARALAEPRRFLIFSQVAREASPRKPLPCSELKDTEGIGPATVSHHLRELADSGLITAVRAGRATHLAPDRKVWKSYLKRLAAI